VGYYWLSEELLFPHHKYTDKDGILALGGDLSVERLLLSYSNGIFPWYNEGEPIIWWSPHKRFILYFENLKISSSLKKFLKKNPYTITYNKSFEQVITNCRDIRIKEGTWITEDIYKAYIDLHKAGYAHSVEVWFGEELVGGLYGVGIGMYFCGESMFTLRNNASKVAIIELCSNLKDLGYLFIDCQVYSPHLEKMGAIEIPRERFLEELKKEVCTELKSKSKLL
jgi:leucyl/phenylalanyl-tRNA--protein transferase